MRYSFNDVDEALPTLATTLRNGDEVGSRLGDRVREITGVEIILRSPWAREVLNPYRGCNVVAQIAETLWVLAGRDDIDWLLPYLPRAADFSDDGKTWRGAYGPRIRRWVNREGDPVDQLRYVVETLTADPTSRRAVISLWDPAVDTAPGKDLPCNNWLAFSNRDGALDLTVGVRSNDLIWGWSGINAFEWSVLQEVVAAMLGVATGRLRFTISSLHSYERHWSKLEKLSRSTSRPAAHGLIPTPRFDPFYGSKYRRGHGLDLVGKLDDLLAEALKIEGKLRRGTACLDEVNEFPEPMLRAWLQTLAAWWDLGPGPSPSTRLGHAYRMIPQSVVDQHRSQMSTSAQTKFNHYLIKLHLEKTRAYGDSWRRRGEQIGIMANIARKVDRLGVSGAGDTAADTVVDLLVYLVKYEIWLRAGATDSDDEVVVSDALRFWGASTPDSGAWGPWSDNAEAIKFLKASFDELERTVTKPDSSVSERTAIVTYMIRGAYPLAEELWGAEQLPKSHSERNATTRWNPEA